MPKILKTKGICLASRRLRETSKLVTFYTEQYGKLALLAKGARSPKSKFGSSLEIFNLSELIFYKKEQKPVYTLSDAYLINNFPTLKIHEKFLNANQIVELILRSVTFEDANHKLFSLVYSALKTLDTARIGSLDPKIEAGCQRQETRDETHLASYFLHLASDCYQSLIGAYLLKAITILGFKPEIRHCVLCKNPKISYFSIENGGVICSSDKHNSRSAVRGSRFGMDYIKTIKYLLTNPLSKSLQFKMPKLALKLIQDYVTYHLEKIELHSFNFTDISNRVNKII